MKRHISVLVTISSLLFNFSLARAQWVQTMNYPSAQNVNAMAAVNGSLFAGTNGGVFKSSDAGGSWYAINTGLTNTTIWRLTYSGNNLYAATGSGIFVSGNSGATWSSISTGVASLAVLAVKDFCAR